MDKTSYRIDRWDKINKCWTIERFAIDDMEAVNREVEAMIRDGHRVKVIRIESTVIYEN